MATQKQGQLLRFVGIILCLISAALMFFGAQLLLVRAVMLIVGIALMATAAVLRRRAKKLQPLVVIIDRGEEKGKPCPLKKTKERDKCPIYQKKRKEALARKPGEIKTLATVFLDCQEKCPYTPK